MSHFEVNLRSFQNKALFDACKEKKSKNKRKEKLFFVRITKVKSLHTELHYYALRFHHSVRISQYIIVGF